MPAGFEFLSVLRINRIMQALQDIRELPQELVFLRRTPVTPAMDNEIMGRWIGRVQIADLISDDAKAAVYNAGKLTFESSAVPNLKHGRNLTQEQLNQLSSIGATGNVRAGEADGMFTNFENSIVDGLLLGIRQRMEALIVAMHLDGFSYDRLGIKMANVSWGMPTDLKVTPSVAWDHQTAGVFDATPIDDILNLVRIGRVRYGVNFNRITLGLAGFNYLTKTADFQNRARTFFYPATPTAPFPLQQTESMINLVKNVTGLAEVELYDSRYWSQDSTGTITSAPYLPINKVILSSTQNDNNADVMDFANAVTTESMVSSIVPGLPGMQGRFAVPTRGPIAYATVPSDMNPPGVTYWGVARGFPRKFRLQANAVLTVGSFSDLIGIGEPF